MLSQYSHTHILKIEDKMHKNYQSIDSMKMTDVYQKFNTAKSHLGA